jgi:diguanylate cyclase (GGDEF)-like protein
MLSSILQISPIAQLPLLQAGQLLLVMGVSFTIITLIGSTYRFHKMIQLGEESLLTVADCNDFFFIQVTRYLSKINRKSSGFGICIIQFCTEESDKRKVQETLLAVLKNTVRNANDKVCLFRDDCVAAIIDTEDENVPDVALRILTELKTATVGINIKTLRVGVSSFPAHGHNTQMIIDAATAALENVGVDNPLPLCIAPALDSATANQETPEAIGELSRQDKHAALDSLTGVLKPAVIGSYMRKYLFDIRQKKGPATLLCVGINRIDQIIKLHSEQTADDVIAGVSEILKAMTRDCDLIGRAHRDDFLILAPCTLQQGEQIATRLREAVQKKVFISGGKQIKTAVSIGITAMPEHGRTLRELFHGAFRALEVVRGWNTTACLIYDPAQHGKKTEHETRR